MTNVRDKFLGECCRKEINVVVFTTNGVQIRGVILASDGQVVVLLREDGRQAMIYQSAISTILPSDSVWEEERKE